MTPLLQVFDMPAAVRFYTEMLGFRLSASSPEIEAPEGRYFHWCLLHRGDAALMLNTAYDAGERPIEPDDARVRAHDDACLYFDVDDVDALAANLRDRGLVVREPALAPYGMRQLYLHDPDGYGICFQTRA